MHTQDKIPDPPSTASDIHPPSSLSIHDPIHILLIQPHLLALRRLLLPEELLARAVPPALRGRRARVRGVDAQARARGAHGVPRRCVLDARQGLRRVAVRVDVVRMRGVVVVLNRDARLSRSQAPSRSASRVVGPNPRKHATMSACIT